jgi:hypothetical protein
MKPKHGIYSKNTVIQIWNKSLSIFGTGFEKMLTNYCTIRLGLSIGNP